jgi:hypothetical protein
MTRLGNGRKEQWIDKSQKCSRMGTDIQMYQFANILIFFES